MDITMIFATILFMIVAVIFSPLGLGGGVLYVPIFHYILEWDFQEAVIGSLTLVLMVTIGSGLAHSKTGNANHDAVKMGRIFAAPSAIIGTLLSGFLISAIGDISIKIIAIAILLFVVNRTINKMNQEEKPGHEGPTQLSDVSQTDGGTINLIPSSPPSGLTDEAYHLYGITLQPGTTYVEIS